jgi:hypothetical protein
VPVLNYVIRKATTMMRLAVQTGSSALDEACVRTKYRSRARSYMSCKPDKYAICFYALVGTKMLTCQALLTIDLEIIVQRKVDILYGRMQKLLFLYK